MLESVSDRLIRTLGIRYVAFFIWDDAEGRFQLELASNRNGKQTDQIPYGLDLSFLSPSPKKPYLFFERTRNLLDVVSHEWAAGSPALHRRAGADLLSAVLGTRPDHRLPGREPHRIARFPVERRCRTADDALGLRGHRDRQRQAVSVLAAQGGRVRTAQGVLRKHCRIHPRGHSGGRSGGSRRKLEFAGREADRRPAPGCGGPEAARAFAGGPVRSTGHVARRRGRPEYLPVSVTRTQTTPR